MMMETKEQLNEDAMTAAESSADEALVFCSYKSDCFANKAGACLALSDTDFGEHRCPFYKSLEDYCYELDESLEQLKKAVRRSNGSCVPREKLDRYEPILTSLGAERDDDDVQQAIRQLALVKRNADQRVKEAEMEKAAQNGRTAVESSVKESTGAGSEDDNGDSSVSAADSTELRIDEILKDEEDWDD